MTNGTYKDIKDVKFKFRKNVEGFAPGINGAKLYNITLAREKQIRKEMGQLKRIYSRYCLKQHPFNLPSKIMVYSRHSYISIEDLYDNIRQNHQKQRDQYRFDIQFGLTLRNNQDDETRQYHPSYNTSFYNDSGIPIINNSIEKLLTDTNFDFILDRTKRENSQWVVENVGDYVILITPLVELLIGSDIKLPEHLKNSKSIIGFGGVPNNMCFWYCLAYHLNPSIRKDRLTRQASAFFYQCYKAKPLSEYQGVNILDIPKLETVFQVNINVYSINETVIDLERHSSSNYQQSLSLNVYAEPQIQRNHFSYIENIHTFTKSFRCANCDVFVSEFKKLKRHYLTCNTVAPKIIFEEGEYSPKQNVFEEMDIYKIFVPHDMRYYPYFILYDFETWLKPNGEQKQGKLKYRGTHELLSISLMGSDETEPIFIPVELSTEAALEQMLYKMEEIRRRYLKHLYETYSPYFKQLSP